MSALTQPVAPITESSATTTKKGAYGRITTLPILTDSRLKTFRRCPREERLRYQGGLLPLTESEALRFGTLWHLGQEAWWGDQGDLEQSESRARAAFLAIEKGATPETDEFEKVRAQELMFGYHVRWHGEQLGTVAVEKEFRLPLINPETGSPSKTWQLAGKLDVLARDVHGALWIVEHKTTSYDIDPSSSYLTRLKLDSQVSMYYRAARELGYEPHGVIYDVVHKVKLRPYKATPEDKRRYTKGGRLDTRQHESDETAEEYRLRVRKDIEENPDKYYARAEIVRLEQEVEEFERELWQVGTTMRDFARLKIAPRNPDACDRYGARCGFFDLCCGQASADDRTRFQVLENLHPELSPDFNQEKQ